ncbi:sterol desaturase family protein [Mesorhizobium sp. C416B]|uniref:sterol desaturase family protein n=1 Tax=unclassified Mesorhizobium TaxID=325217 RepID=UPI0003CF9762|nr:MULTISPECIES: sterol desaturase family protein [unclassified Mesorhizobium]ESX46748.1 fatty acid hydroxylase [Mesorhizobium sp. LSHC426A00]ESX58434.1 fatty acid hydroxylase [Mesorhizobium sp. LSHC424B00]ESX71971.1 fatty acid hydroxylase [Mesorhizobium sp. LSHC416B00]WJI65276.1 sterol desaturase family protein [Mesorhizobium sp. C416B]
MDLFGLKSLLICALIFVPLERILTLRPPQKILRKGLAIDAIYAILNGTLVRACIFSMAAIVMSVAALLVPERVLDTIGGQPTWLQVIEIIILADLGVYAAHRAFHAVPALWRFHSIHHGIEELDWVASFRAHPVDQIITKAVSLMPVFFLGFSTEAIAIYFLVYTGHALLLHANVRINFGPLKWLIASPQFHHWHHADHRDAYDKNFASQLSIIDLLFGTFHVPGSAMPEKYGVDEPIPASYLGQFGYRFMPKPKERGNAEIGAVKQTPDA